VEEEDERNVGFAVLDFGGMELPDEEGEEGEEGGEAEEHKEGDLRALAELLRTHAGPLPEPDEEEGAPKHRGHIDGWDDGLRHALVLPKKVATEG
jgi:hypothetical protein